MCCLHAKLKIQYFYNYLERYFTALNISGLKDLWPSVKVYNIKKIFDRSAIKNPQNNNEIEIPF